MGAMLQRHWKELIKPYKIKLDRFGTQLNAATLVFEPLEKGFGTTLGNALRRVLLSSLQGSAFTSVQFDDVLHEFSTLPGVVEGTTDIILNLKNVSVKMLSEIPKRLRLRAKGPCVVTAGMIEVVDGIEILSPDQEICTLGAGHQLNAELTVEVGKGYFPVSQRSKEDLPVGLILMDAHFSPVRRVSFHTESARVGQNTDYDKLFITVETDGSLSPEDAVGIAARIIQDQLQKFVNFDDPIETEPASKSETKKFPFNRDLLRKVEELELSLRAGNCLKRENIIYIGDLVTKTESDLLKTPNFGRKSLNEISGILKQMDLKLGMDVPEWPPEDLDQLLKMLDKPF